MSQIGKQIVDFKVQAYAENGFKEVSKQDVLGKWSIFFFYPADFTFVCPTELEDLADLYDQFKATGAEIYSVSTDTHFVHKAWQDASATIKKIKYPMLGDPTGVLSRGFNVMIEEAGLAERGTFIVITSYSIHYTKLYENKPTCSARPVFAISTMLNGRFSISAPRDKPT